MKRQKILIDGLGLVEGHFSGVGQYILGILRGMDQLIDEARYNGEKVPRIVVIIPRDTVAKFKAFAFKHLEYKCLPLPFRYVAALWHRGKMPPIDLWCGRGDYIFPRFVDMPLLFNKSKVLIVIDASFELYRQYSDEGNAIFLSKGVRESIKRARNVVSISESTRKDVSEVYGLNSKDISVATPAVDQKLFYRRSQQEIDSVKQKYGIKAKKYILALSNLEPRKNLESLVDAYCALPASARKDTALLLVGVNGWKAAQLFDKIISKVREGYDIIRPSQYVSDDDKPAIISGASMLVYPSHYEGFGMPPLEALACGVPVITADNSSLPEVVGNAGVTVASDDLDGLTNAIQQYLNDLDGVTKKAMIEGPRRARLFSWRESAQTILDLAGDKR